MTHGLMDEHTFPSPDFAAAATKIISLFEMQKKNSQLVMAMNCGWTDEKVNK